MLPMHTAPHVQETPPASAQDAPVLASPLHVPVNTKPSLFNARALEWAFWSGLGASLLTLPLRIFDKKHAIATVLGGELIGAAIGAMRGRDEQIREREEGRKVSPATYWNHGIAAGMGGYSLAITPLMLMEAGGVKVSHLPLGVGATLQVGAGVLGSVAVHHQMVLDEKALQKRHETPAPLPASEPEPPPSSHAQKVLQVRSDDPAAALAEPLRYH